MNPDKSWTNILGEDEKVIHAFTASETFRKFNFTIWAVLGVISIISLVDVFMFICLGSYLLPLSFALCFYYGYYLKVAYSFAFTDKQIIVQRGLFNTRITTAKYENITDTSIRVGWLEKRFTHSGTIRVNTAGTTFFELNLIHVDSPYEIKKELDSIRLNSEAHSDNS